MRAIICSIVGTLAIALCSWSVSAWQGMMIGGRAPSIASVSLSNSTFTNSTANNTVGTVSIILDPRSAVFTGSISLTGSNSGGFHLVGTTLETNSSGTTTGTYNDVNIVATQPGASNTPQQITPTLTGGGGGSITCLNGQTPFAGSAPTEAALAGFTTCAANFDFTNALYATQSNWMDCTQTDATKIWHNFFPSQNCSYPRFTDTTVSPNVNTVDVHWQPSFGTTGNNLNMFAITYLNPSTSLTFPNHYFEAVARIDQANLTPSIANVNLASAYECQVDKTGARVGVPILENDPFELSGGSSGGTGNVGGAGFGDGGSGYPGCGGSATQGHSWQSFNANNLPAGWRPIDYHKYGMLVTSDGSTSTYTCFFVDDVLMGSSCGASITVAADVYLQRYYLFFWQQVNSASSPAQDIYFQYIRIWSCAAGMPPVFGQASNMCNGATHSTSNGIDYWH